MRGMSDFITVGINEEEDLFKKATEILTKAFENKKFTFEDANAINELISQAEVKQTPKKVEQTELSEDEIVNTIKEIIEDNDAEKIGVETYLFGNIPTDVATKIIARCERCIKKKDIVFAIYEETSYDYENYFVFTKDKLVICITYSDGSGRYYAWKYSDVPNIVIETDQLKFSDKSVDFDGCEDDMPAIYNLIMDIVDELG